MPSQVFHKAGTVSVLLISRHVVVSNDDVRTQLRNLADQLRRTHCLAHDFETRVTLNNFAYAHQYNRVIVGQ